MPKLMELRNQENKWTSEIKTEPYKESPGLWLAFYLAVLALLVVSGWFLLIVCRALMYVPVTASLILSRTISLYGFLKHDCILSF